MPTASPSTLRGRLSRQRILDAAEKVFGEKGYFRASISDITREAGVAQGTFYLYFKSKKDVFTELLDFLARLVRKETTASLSQARDRVEEEARGFYAFFALVNDHPHFYRIVREAEFVDETAFRRYYTVIVDGYTKRIRNAMDRGDIRRIEPETLVYCLMGIGDLVGMRWPYWTGRPIPPAIFDAMMQFIRWGIDPRSAPTAG